MKNKLVKFYRKLSLLQSDIERFHFTLKTIDTAKENSENDSYGSIYSAHRKYLESCKYYSRPSYDFPELKKYYRNSDNDSYKDYFLIYAESEEHAETIMCKHVDIDENFINSVYDCTGQWFNYEMEFRSVGNGMVLCKQWHGMDV
ncbi:hypothetical protein BSK59_15620 [Paenibacillus odorifer]|uniref:hypothetical protein n=1 Tax=Paenibacillus odorifer TaxID=189426 RepID=UPI00096DC748|nr:hypothetical protein [Paenibacillus odorifer]OME54008.1 hypothetical protein BSK59_15620 [Paenibacillus odorifer]